MQFIDGAPAELNRALQYGEVDCAPSSSIEYARNHQNYSVIPGFSTGGQSKIKSVLFLSRVPWEKINGLNVILSAASGTSNILFQILCQRKYRVDPIFNMPEEPVGRIAIGNEALQMAYNSSWNYCYDLAEEWYKWQALPFSFGLWIVRNAILESKRELLKKFIRELEDSKNMFFQSPKDAVRKWTDRYPADLPERIILSFFENIDYNLTPLHEKSLNLFFKLASDLGYSAPCPSLKFLSKEDL
jgi:chorismate dehydratase